MESLPPKSLASSVEVAGKLRDRTLVSVFHARHKPHISSLDLRATPKA